MSRPEQVNPATGGNHHRTADRHRYTHPLVAGLLLAEVVQPRSTRTRSVVTAQITRLHHIATAPVDVGDHIEPDQQCPEANHQKADRPTDIPSITRAFWQELAHGPDLQHMIRFDKSNRIGHVDVDT
jgi:hypothetical protein